MGAVKTIGRVLRRIADWFPLTWLGIGVALGAWAALSYLAYAELDLVWLVVGYALLGLVAASLLSVIVGAITLKIVTRQRPGPEIEPHSMDTQRVNPTGFETPTFWFLPLVQVDWTWEQPNESDVSISNVRWRLKEKVKLGRRGHVNVVRRRIVIQDPFGLARLAIRQTAKVRLTVLPHAGKLGETPMLVSVSGGDERPHPMGIADGDRVELRRYAPGDPARFIHWKVYGRTRKLMVRMPERALSPSRRTIAYQVAGPDDDASAAAARVAVESGVFGAEWSFCADGATKDTSRIAEAVEMIVASADAREQGAKGLEPFIARAERAGPASAVIFVPPRPGPWLERVVRAIKPRAVRTRVVVTTDGIDASPEAPLWRRLLVLPEGREGTPSAQLDQVIKALAATRCEVIVLDRKSGKRLGAKHRAAMRKAEGKRAA